MPNKIVATHAWTNKSASISVRLEDMTPNINAMSGTSKSSSARSCIHTFSVEKFEELFDMPQEDFDAVKSADAKNMHPIPHHNIGDMFSMALRIQIVEAIGVEEALKLAILKRDKNGVILGLENALKMRKNDAGQLEPVKVGGLQVYRHTILRPDSDDYKDIFVKSSVAPTAPQIPHTGGDEAAF
jgi:hypothetical protein